jgi:hypothetical protein
VKRFDRPLCPLDPAAAVVLIKQADELLGLAF